MIFHISDIHFGQKPKDNDPTQLESTHYFRTEDHEPRPDDLAEILLDYAPETEAPEAVVLTGDLGWSGAARDYSYALKFLMLLRASWKETTFILTAGNHDVDLGAPDDASRQDHFIAFLRNFYGAEFSTTFPHMGDCTSQTRRDDLVGSHSLASGLQFLSLNSAASIQKLGDPILVRPRTLQLLSKLDAGLPTSETTLKALVLHHHLLPFIEPPWTETINTQEVRERPDTSIVANSAAVQQWLSDRRIRLVFHGHKHIFHGREDTLWHGKPGSRALGLLVLGAGSAGVMRKKLGNLVPHCFTQVRPLPAGRQQWILVTDVKEIPREGGPSGVSTLASRVFELREEPDASSPSIATTKIGECHAAIRLRLASAGTVRNFVSFVEDSKYTHPPTLQIGAEPATYDHVERSFTALHPEYDSVDGWAKTAKVDEFFSRLEQPYRIQHGTRLFSRVRYLDLAAGALAGGELRPIVHAVKRLHESPTRGYVGLFNPEKDLSGLMEPLPGLVGVQFLPRPNTGKLDIVMMFRNIELSFWWAVNMLEAWRLLKWACPRVGPEYTPGSTTFFSSLAEWKTDPRPMFVSSLDSTPYEELFVLIMSADAGSAPTIQLLRNTISEKAEETNVNNIDYSGLTRLLSLCRGVLTRRTRLKIPSEDSVIQEAFASLIHQAVEELRNAVANPDERENSIAVAKNRLKAATEALESA